MKENLLEKCPLCGAKIVDAYNSVTKQFYYKCENSGCHFRLPKNYTEEEVSLQGIELKAVCEGCGNPLTIACGPNSLYATCLRCGYDLRPNMINGFVFKKHANAHNPDAEQEIKELEEAYKGTVDEDYSFDDFLGTKEELQEEGTQKEVADEPTQEINENELFGKVSKKEYIHYYNKGYTINQLSQHFEISRCQVRGIKKFLISQGIISKYAKKTFKEGSALQKILDCMKNNLSTKFDADMLHSATGVSTSTIGNYLTQLRKTNLIKIVGYKETYPLTILYQVTESPLEEVSYKTIEEGYVTLRKFFKDNEDFLKGFSKSMSPITLKTIINNSTLKSAPLMTEIGLGKGYNKDELLAFIKSYFAEPLDVKDNNKGKIKGNEELSKSALTNVLELFKEDLMKPHDSKNLSKSLGYKLVTTQMLLKKLRCLNKVKIVGNEGSRVLYQMVESPLPELKVFDKNENYTTLSNFTKLHKELGVSTMTLKKKIKKENLPSYPMLTNSGISKGYEIKKLLKLCQNYHKPAIMQKESLEGTSKVQPKVLPNSSHPKKGISSLLAYLFKNKKEENVSTEELISF